VLRFAVRRLMQLVPILLGLSVLLFLWIRALPGGPAIALLGERATPEKIAQINRLYGLDRPWYEQYWSFLGRAVQLNFGSSIRTQRPVSEEFLRLFPATIELSLVATIFAVRLRASVMSRLSSTENVPVCTVVIAGPTGTSASNTRPATT